jgi:DNA-binding response OmpR family regulator
MPKTILIVEDDRGVAKQLTRTVEDAGYTCEVASDGVAALQQASKARPDLILLDLLLPKKDGRKVLASLQGSGDTRDIPVIAMSGVFRGRSTARELHDAGAQGFLDKPFSSEDLLGNVHALIGPPEDPSEQSGTGRAEADAASNSAEPGQVSLARSTAAELLWQAMSEGFSGALQFQIEKRHKVVVLCDGVPIQVRSNQASECLGRRLFRAGRIDGDALQESLRRTREEGGRQGEILVGMGAITEDEVEHELLAQAEDKLLELFSWDDGSSWRQSGVSNISFATELQGWTPRLVTLRGVSRMSEERAQRLLAPIANLKLAVSESDLSDEELVIPHVAEAIAVVRSGAPTASLIESYPAAIYGLWLTGIARLIDPESGQVITELAPNDASSQEADPELTGLREELAEFENKDYFELFGVERDATAGDVRKAFTKLVKDYHPDRYSKKPADVRAAASNIFSLLSSASTTLSDENARKEYLQKLTTGGSVEDERKTAALEQFAKALEKGPDEADHNAYFGWTHYLVNHRDPDAEALAKRHIELAISIAPNSATSYYFLGQLHKACNREQQALKMFRKVLDLQPEHVEAAREVRLIGMRKAKDDKAGGLFGFGKKRK